MEEKKLTGDTAGNENATKRTAEEFVSQVKQSNDVVVPQSKKQPDEESGSSILQRVRTYKDDIARTVRKQGASFTSIAAAEERRRSGIPEDMLGEKRGINGRRLFLLLGGFTLLSAAALLLGYLFFFYNQEEVVVEETFPSIIFAEKETGIDITDKNPKELLSLLKKEGSKASLPLGQILNIYMIRTDKKTGARVAVSGREFLEAINAGVNDAFLRSLEQPITIGLHAFNGFQPFIILKSRSYQSSFAGMLDWETSMYRELLPFLGHTIDEGTGVPINPQTGEQIIVNDFFSDRIIGNIDTRVLTDQTENVRLLYAFPNLETLVITTNEHTFTEIFTRLSSVRVF